MPDAPAVPPSKRPSPPSFRAAPRPAVYEFAPRIGAYAYRIAELANDIAIRGDAAFADLERSLGERVDRILSGGPASENYARLLFSWSLLVDLRSVGGSVVVRDSRILVSWPDWEGPDGREVSRRALIAASELRPLTSDEMSRVAPLFAPDTDGEVLSEVVRTARFWLQAADTFHPSGVSYSEGFNAAIRLWSMPYRGRQGRQKRFVLLCEHPRFGRAPVIAGILEMGDEAPFCTWRDSLLGLDTNSVFEWLRESVDARSAGKSAAETLRKLRAALLPTAIARSIRSAEAVKIVERRAELEDRAKGRSRSGDDFCSRKRIAYAVRLARGEVFFQKLAQGEGLASLDRRDLAAGVRAVHDLFLPRLHMEATVCGPVPPFSYALGGKLIIAFLAHPEVLALPAEARGTVLEQCFDLERLVQLLPSHGMLALTTKGLYARHAPMYNRAAVPGTGGPLRLEHITNTEGTTTTLISERTAKLGRLVLSTATEKGIRQVSMAYGSGGAKRHRTIEAAATTTGLPPQIVSAGIRRPVYAVRLVRSPHAAIWTNEDPGWLIRKNESGEQYSARATEMWRRQWLDRAQARAHELAFVPSVIDCLGANSANRIAD